MWFTTGGRRTQSALYRVRWAGKPDENADFAEKAGASVADGGFVRKSDSKWEIKIDPVEVYLPNLENEDRDVRFRMRLGLENSPPDQWRDAALKSQNPWALMALARVGEESDRGPILKILAETIEQGSFAEQPKPNRQSRLDELDGAQRSQTLLTRLRAIQLACIRLGEPTDAEKKMLREALEPLFPHDLQDVNHELCEILVYLRSDKVLGTTLDLLDASDDSRDWSHYLMFLRYLEDDFWTTDDRHRYLEGLKKFDSFAGGRWWIRAGESLRKEFVARLSEEEKSKFAELIPPQQPKPDTPPAAPPTEIVKAWTMEDFANLDVSGRDLKRGEAAYVKGQCAVCHKKAGNGASARAFLGPDLTSIANRFGPSDILESILHPSRVIADKYRNPAGPNISTMPPGLIYGLERDEVLDLIGYLAAE
ncbi:MAG: c-type cytochrome, partial [Verrucomicrobiales bacterium]|nr:c-type cytochrome [Verrucomicrobiales bacterium]